MEEQKEREKERKKEMNIYIKGNDRFDIFLVCSVNFINMLPLKRLK
jgi:hypothetical protein